MPEYRNYDERFVKCEDGKMYRHTITLESKTRTVVDSNESYNGFEITFDMFTNSESPMTPDDFEELVTSKLKVTGYITDSGTGGEDEFHVPASGTWKYELDDGDQLYIITGSELYEYNDRLSLGVSAVGPLKDQYMNPSATTTAFDLDKILYYAKNIPNNEEWTDPDDSRITYIRGLFCDRVSWSV